MNDPIDEVTAEPTKRPIVPLNEYAGKYIAWDHRETRIVASAQTLEEVLEAAEKAGEAKPVIEKIPKRMRYIGEIA